MRRFQQDLLIYQGDDWAAMVTVINADGTIPDLTGYTAQAQIREGVADQAWQTEADLTCAVVPPNQISISLTNLQTTALGQPVYRWDLQLVSPAGIITTIMAGEVRMLFEVTRSSEAEEMAAQARLDRRYLVPMEER